MGKLIFETWGEGGKHSSLSFDQEDLAGALTFARDYVQEHRQWGRWTANPGETAILSLKTASTDTPGQTHYLTLVESADTK